MDAAARNIFNLVDDQYKKDMRIKSNPPNNQTSDDAQNILTDKYIEGTRASTAERFQEKIKNLKKTSGEAVGDFFITDDFGEKERQEKESKRHKKDEKNKQRVYKLLARKEFILKKLASMNLSKKKHINEVADLNYKLEMIDWELTKIKEESGFDYMKIQHGSKIQQLMAYVSKKFKKVKKFVTRNWPTIQNVIVGIGTVIIPIIIGIFAGRKKPVVA